MKETGLESKACESLKFPVAMLIPTIAFACALTLACAQEGSVCVCVNETQCVDGRIQDESAIKDANPDDFHNGEGLITERFQTCDWQQVCCTVPSHLHIPGQPDDDNPTTPTVKEGSSEESNESGESNETKDGDSSSEEDDDDPEIPRVDDLKGCGVRRRPPLRVQVDIRISGLEGPENTFYGEAPWMTRILGANGFACGGTLVHPKVVLTAAHCIKRVKGGKLIAEVGEWNTESKKEPLSPQRQEPTKIVKHPDFNSKNLKNDVALVFFENPFNTSEAVDIICTAESIKDVNGDSCVAVGWGKTEHNKSAPYQAILRKVQLPLMDRDTCESRLKGTRLGPKFRLPSGFVCAGGTVEGDTCMGDGGGPLYCSMKSEPNRMAIVGVTAWGIDCGKGNPAVFASVPDQLNWIYSTISKMLEDD